MKLRKERVNMKNLTLMTVGFAIGALCMRTVYLYGVTQGGIMVLRMDEADKKKAGEEIDEMISTTRSAFESMAK